MVIPFRPSRATNIKSSVENLADRDGLLRYIARKIGVGNVCIWCNEMGKAFYSLTAVRQHMIGLYLYLVAITGTCICL